MTIQTFCDMDELPNFSVTSDSDVPTDDSIDDLQTPSFHAQASDSTNHDLNEDAASSFKVNGKQSGEGRLYEAQPTSPALFTPYADPKARGSNGDQISSTVASRNIVDGQANKPSGHFTRNRKRIYRAHQQQQAKLETECIKKPVLDYSSPRHAHWAPKRHRVAMPEMHPSDTMTKQDFMMKCGLLSSSSAQKLKNETEKHDDVDLDCQIVAVEGPISEVPLQSPRTTRSLMSHVSRENTESVRKRLSQDQDTNSEEGSENETLDAAVVRRSARVSLMPIDFSSPLGQRLKKHATADLAVPPISDIEQYCSTEPVADDITSKLRLRTSEYPVMSRKRKGMVTGYCHKYKFNKAERVDFMRTLETGLNNRSRHLLQQIDKKAVVRLSRLRQDVISRWTMKKRTIVCREIEIDEDISIVQVEVPEHIYRTVQKYRLSSQTHSVYEDPAVDSKYIADQETYPYARNAIAPPVHQHTYHQRSAHISCPSYPSSSRDSPTPAPGPAPVPQFLVKQVSKNWTENGQESQKLVFVPLDKTSPSQHPNISIRGIPAASGKRPYNLSSSGQKSLPRRLRPGPKSRRKQLLEDRQGEDEDFTIETASSSDEDLDLVGGKKPKTESVYPLPVSKSGHWRVSDTVVPQMLHVANSSSMNLPVSVSNLMSRPTAGLVPVSVWEPHLEESSGRDLVQQHSSGVPLHLGRSTPATTSNTHSEVKRNVYAYNSTHKIPTDISHSSSTCPDQIEGRNRTMIEIPNLQTVNAFHPQREQGLTSAQKLAALCQPPNFLQPSCLPKLFDPNNRSVQRHSLQQSKQVSQQGRVHTSSKSMPPLRYNPPVQHRNPSPPVRQLYQQQTELNSGSGHQASMRLGVAKLHSPLGFPQEAATSAKVSPGGNHFAPKTDNPTVVKTSSTLDSQPSSDRARSSQDWKVIRACDDDVVEIICIDDDD